jgi:serine/threonine protein kinase
VARICPDPSCARKYPDDVSFCGECGKITIAEQSPQDFDARLGQRLGDYLVVARVADGAMGRVYEGRHHATRARVAIKVLHPDVARDNVSVERFRREYDTARELNHPHSIKVIEFGATPEGQSFMTMEYLEGEELGLALRRNDRLPPARAIRMLCQLARGLEHAHSFGFIHRDLKPDNIFLCKSPEGDVVRILDFGSVKLQMETGPKLTAFGTTLGSPYYMSPEQAMGKQDVDSRTDVFALAAIAYEAFTGKIVFDGAGVAQILLKIINEQPPLASHAYAGVPPALDDVLDRGLRKDKSQRHATAGELAADICTAFGLSPDVERWASTPVAAIEAELKGARQPVSMPYRSLASSGGSVTAGRQSAGRMSASGTTGNDLPSVVSAGTSPGMKLLIAALTALVIGLALAVLLR